MNAFNFFTNPVLVAVLLMLTPFVLMTQGFVSLVTRISRRKTERK